MTTGEVSFPAFMPLFDIELVSAQVDQIQFVAFILYSSSYLRREERSQALLMQINLVWLLICSYVMASSFIANSSDLLRCGSSLLLSLIVYSLFEAKIQKYSKNMENHAFGFFMKNIVFYIYLGIVKYTYTV